MMDELYIFIYYSSLQSNNREVLLTRSAKLVHISNTGNEEPDQTVRLRSLIRAFIARLSWN